MKGLPEIDGYVIRQCLARSEGKLLLRAFQQRLAREVLLEWLPPEKKGDALEEVLRTAVHVRTSLLPEIIDLVTLPTGARCLVLEDSHVQPLLPILRGGHLDAQQCVALGMQLAEGLEALAEAHVILGVLTPEQIYVNEQSEPMLLCFSAMGFEESYGPAPSGWSAASLPFAAPEVVQGKTFDRRAEVWSVALVLYAFLTGQRPFGAVPLEELAEVQRNLCLPSPCDIRAHIPEALGKILQWMTLRSPEARPAAWDEIRMALYRSGDGFAPETLTTEDSVLADPTPQRQYYGGQPIRLSSAELRRYHETYASEQAARKSTCLWIALVFVGVLVIIGFAIWKILPLIPQWLQGMGLQWKL